MARPLSDNPKRSVLRIRLSEDQRRQLDAVVDRGQLSAWSRSVLLRAAQEVAAYHKARANKKR